MSAFRFPWRDHHIIRSASAADHGAVVAMLNALAADVGADRTPLASEPRPPVARRPGSRMADALAVAPQRPAIGLLRRLAPAGQAQRVAAADQRHRQVALPEPVGAGKRRVGGDQAAAATR